MRAVIEFIAREPAMVVTLILAIANSFADLNAGQADAVRQMVEAAIILLSGTVIRQSVTPVRRGDQQ